MRTLHLKEIIYLKLRTRELFKFFPIQLQYVNGTAKRSSRGDSENYGGIRYVISQLVAIRDEDANGYQGLEFYVFISSIS